MIAIMFCCTLAGQALAHKTTHDQNGYWKTLERPISLVQQAAPVRHTLARIGEAYGITIFLDRRIDPGKLITLQTRQVTLREALTRFAERYGWGISYLPPVVYVGPIETTRELATHLEIQKERLGKLPDSVRSFWLSQQPRQWPRLAEPRQVVEQILGRMARTTDGLDRIPHDLWDEQQLPQLDRLQALMVVLAGFDLAPVIQSDGQLRIADLPRGQVVQRTYSIPADANINAAMLRATTAAYRQVRFRRNTNTLVVRGPVEAHRSVSNLLIQQAADSNSPAAGGSSPSPTKPPPPRSLQRFTLTVKNRKVEVILGSICQQLDVQLVWKIDDPEIRQARIDVAVQNATLGQLLEAILGRFPVRYWTTRSQLVIVPMSSE